MRNDYFTTTKKLQTYSKTGATGATGTEKASNDAASSKAPPVAHTQKLMCNTCNTPPGSVAPVAHAKKPRATDIEPQEASNNAASSDALHLLHVLHQKTDNSVNTASADGTVQPFSQKELDAIKAGHAVKVWLGVLNDWLFWVRDEERKQKATAKGIDAWRLWTLAELTAVQGMERQDLKNLHALKRQFNGTLNPGEPPARWRDALEPLQPTIATAEVQP